MKTNQASFEDLENWIPCLTDYIVLREDDKKVVHLVNLSNVDYVYTISGFAAEILKLVDGKKCWSQIANRIGSKFAELPRKLKYDLAKFSDWLIDLDLIDYVDVSEKSFLSTAHYSKSIGQLNTQSYRFGSYKKLNFESVLYDMPITAMASSESDIYY